MKAKFFELGRAALDDKSEPTVWVPVLHLGARTGYSWATQLRQTLHTFTVVGFDERDGRQILTILEKRTTKGNDGNTYEILYTYGKGVGLVERRETATLAGKEKRTVSELRLVKVEDR
jgi:hypothetical protein